MSFNGVPISTSSSQHYTIASEDVSVDQTNPLGPAQRNGRVLKGYWNDSVVAVKLLKSEIPGEVFVNRVERWQALRHPHVFQIFGGSSQDANPAFIISQYYPNGNANEFLLKNPDVDRAKMLYECALGMKYLHEHGIVHGGLKPTNILIAENSQASIADFGMAELDPSGNTSSHRYFSPEAWKGKTSQASDVYAFSMCCYEVFMSIAPWGVLSETHIYQLVVREDERPERIDLDMERKRGLTERIWEIMEFCWQKNAALRPKFVQVTEMWRNQSSQNNSVSLNSHPAYDTSSSSHQVLRSRQASPTPDFVSMLTMPPAYGDVDRRRPPPIGQAEDSRIDAQSDPDNRSRVSTPSSITVAGDHISASPSISPSIAAYTLTPLTSIGSPSPSNVSFYSSMPFPFSSRRRLNIDDEFADSVAACPVSQSPRELQRLPSELSNSPTPQEYFSLRPQLSRAATARRPRTDTGSVWSHSHSHSAQPSTVQSEVQSIQSEGYRSVANVATGRFNAVLLAGALHAEVTEGRNQDVIDDYLHRARSLSLVSSKDAQKLVTAGIVPTVILLLKARAIDGVRLEIVLAMLGTLACDSITANTVFRTNTAATLIEIIDSTESDDLIALSTWCIVRICRSSEVAAGLIKQDIARLMVRKGLKGNLIPARLSAWCLGMLSRSDALALTLAAHEIIIASVDHLRRVSINPNASTWDICASMYLVARLSRTIHLSKQLIKERCIPMIVHYLSSSNDPHVVHWSARAVGCLMRPNGSDISKALLDAGTARALARLPRILSSHDIEPLGSFAFAIQRFSCAEWGGGTRKALVEAGVVDSLLSALRTAADVPYPQVHIELALAVSFLGDVGGSSIRKEIVRAGGIDIIKRVGATGRPEVTKACNMAVTSITGNLWTRNAASAKTAMSHDWSGGCPDYQPECPLEFAV